MVWGRVLSSSAAVVGVAGCAVLAVGMGRAASRPTAEHRPTAGATATARPAYLPGDVPSANGPTLAVSSSAPATATRTVRPATSHPVSSVPVTTRAAPGTQVVVTHAAATVVRRAAAPTHAAPRPAPRPTTRAATAHGQSLPLGYYTGSATRVITVVAGSRSSTTAQLQAWTRVSGGWARYGSSVTAHIGSDGMTTAPSEFRSATPMGSHTLTQAFGRYSNPGTGLPYFKTDPYDYWVSAEGPTYNTHQRCYSSCNSANERLYYETPYYNYAVVIDTPSGSAAWPHGSAFFLHVTDGAPTAGCVAIPQTTLVTLMRWLTPSAHPRILIGTA